MVTEVAPLSAAHPAGFPSALVVGSSVALRLFIPGKPEPKRRHRARVVQAAGRKPFVQTYSDGKSRDYEQMVADVAVHQVRTVPVDGDGQDFTLPFTGRVLVTLRLNMPKPVSYPKSVVHHTKKPDVDNLAKAVLDGLVHGGVLKDDGLVTDLTTFKRYVEDGHPEGVEIDLTVIGTDPDLR